MKALNNTDKAKAERTKLNRAVYALIGGHLRIIGLMTNTLQDSLIKSCVQ